MTEVRFTHIGGPTVLVEFAGWRLLTDPTFDPPGRTYSCGWGTSSRKLTGPALTPEEIGPVDAVLLTHDHHGDNLDDAGRALLAGVTAVVTTRAGARRLGGTTVRGLKAGQTTQLQAPDRPPVDVTATPADTARASAAPSPGRSSDSPSPGPASTTDHCGSPETRFCTTPYSAAGPRLYGTRGSSPCRSGRSRASGPGVGDGTCPDRQMRRPGRAA